VWISGSKTNSKVLEVKPSPEVTRNQLSLYSEMLNMILFPHVQDW